MVEPIITLIQVKLYFLQNKTANPSLLNIQTAQSTLY